MITFTHCAFMAKQACATFSQVVQKITPPIANNFLKFFFALFATLTLNAATAWAETTTYTFNSKSWGDSSKGWISSKDGNQFTSSQGVQVTTGTSGANATTNNSFTNVSSIAVQYCTNDSKGAGSIKIQVGSNTEKTFSVTKPSSDGKTLKTATFTFDPNETGKVKITVSCTTNSVYIYSVAITTADAVTCTTPPTVSAGSHSDVTTTTATVSCSGGITSLGSAGCSITSYGFVYGTTANPTTSNVQVGTTYTTKGTAFSKALTGLTANTTYYVRPYATNGNGTAYGTQTSFKTLELPKYTVTLKAGPGTCAESVTETSAGAGVTLPTPTLDCGDWEFAGWTTSSVATETTFKPEILLTGTYSPSTDITLYAVYRKTEETEGSNEESKTITLSPPTTTSSYKEGTKTDSEGNTWSYYAAINNQSGTLCFGLNSNSLNYNIGSPAFDGKVSSVSFKAWNGSSSETRKFLFCSTNTIAQPTKGDLAEVSIPKSQQFTETYTADLSQSSVSQFYIYAPKALGITAISVTYTTSTTYYHSTPECAAPCTDFVTISQGTLSNGSFKLDKTGKQSTCDGSVTVTLSNIQPATGYQFSEITQLGINTGVTIDNNNQKVTYAKNTTGTSTINVVFTPIEYTLALESTLSCVTNGSATIAYNATSAKNFTAATRDDYTCTGYWSAPSGGVQVLKADGTFVGDVSGFISGGKWVNTTATKLTPRWETEYKMILSKGTEENGTYTLSPTNIETSGCATSITRQVTITATPVAGYEVDQITYSGEGIATIKTGPTISAGKTTWVYTFAENDKGTGTFTVTFKQLPKYTVTWMANEQLHADQTSVVGTSLTNPGDPEASTYACDDKVFVGWTAVKNYSNTTTAPDDLFKSAEATSKTIPENGITYYAVFANATTIPGTTTTTEETATLSFADAAQRESISSTQQVWKQNGIVFTNNQAESSNEVADYVNPVRCYKSSDIIIDCNDLGNITKVQFKCTTSEYANNLKNSIGSEASTTTTWVTLIPKTETKVYEISLSSGQTRISSLIVTYEKTIVSDPTVTYSNYSTTCVPAPKLVSIAQTAGQIEFTEGDEFVKATITATYEDESTKDITSKATFSTPDMTQVGEQTISVSYKEGEVTAETSYKINIKEKTKYTITWWANGEEYYTQTAVEGTAIDVPTNSPNAATYACDDKVFVGWVDAEISGSTNTEPTFITEFGEIEGDKAFFAVFATETSAGIESTIHTLTPSNSWSGYKEGSITDDKGYTWSYNAAGQSTDGVYSLNLRNKDTETSYIGSPLFTANVKNIKATIVNGSASKARKVYVCSVPTLEPTTGDLGITEVAGGHSGELSLAFEGTISQFYLQVSDALQFQSIVVEVGATTTYSGYVTTCEKPTYTRDVTPYEYGTICLPYGSNNYTGAEFYEVSSVEYGKGLWLDQLAAGTALAAGKPYIFRATAEKLAVVYKGEKKDSPVAGENGLTGTFTDIAAGGVQGHYIIAKNQIWVANDKNTLPAYRAYINAEDVPTTAQAQLPGRRRVCMGENAATGLDNITNGENNTIKVIENGQLIIIRNGEKFNVQGQKL